MSSQIFKSLIPIDILFELLEKICVKDDKYYHLSKTSYKSAAYHNLLDGFYSNIIDYYHISKRHYVDRKMNYKRFLTIIRQICSVNNVSYKSSIVFNNSNYEIIYFIERRDNDICMLAN
jgi:hypothetical protein